MRAYSKGNPEKELQPQKAKSTIEVKTPAVFSVEQHPLNYQKLDLEEMPKAFFVLISGGEDREKGYFKIISLHDTFKRIKLEFIADPLRLSPDGMYEIAEYKKNRYNSSKNVDEEPDKIYLISDVDHFMAELLRIKPKCTKEGFSLIISNSCFEIWLYYAYFDSVPNFTIPSDPLKTSSRFKGWLPSAIRGGVKTTRAILNIYQNIENARKAFKVDNNGIPVLFSTNMFELAENLLPLIEPELTNMINENRRDEVEFRNRTKNSHAII